MTEIERLDIPGRGVTYRFTAQSGVALGVVCGRDGGRDLVIYDREDPDTAAASAGLTGTEAHYVAGLLQHTATVDIHAPADGPAIGNFPVTAAGPYDGQPLSAVPGHAAVLAVVRDDGIVRDPPPDWTLRHGDTLVAAGTPPALSALGTALTGDY